MKHYLRILAVVIILCGCAHHHSIDQADPKIVHVVLIWLKEPGNKNHINEVIQTTYNLKSITEVQELRVGKSVLSERPIVDDSFDVGITMLFNCKEELEAYLVHPIHKQAVEAVLRPLAKKILVYDIEDTQT